jgi:hypothetical protein
MAISHKPLKYDDGRMPIGHTGLYDNTGPAEPYQRIKGKSGAILQAPLNRVRSPETDIARIQVTEK